MDTFQQEGSDHVDMYERDLNNNAGWLLTDNRNHLYPKSVNFLSKGDWLWQKKKPLGSHTTASPFSEPGTHGIDPLKYASNNYKEVRLCD